MSKKYSRVWEIIIKDYTYRMKVHGGWLVSDLMRNGDGKPDINTLCFVPDQKHEWELEEVEDVAEEDESIF